MCIEAHSVAELPRRCERHRAEQTTFDFHRRWVHGLESPVACGTINLRIADEYLRTIEPAIAVS
jgi:hypothetical protein